MSFIPVPNGMRVVLNGLMDSLPVVNVFYVVAPGAPSPTDLSAVEAVFQSWVGADLNPWQSDWYLCPEITVTDVSVASGRQFIASGLTSQGAIAGDAAPANAALVISWRTPFTGRSFRGRTYVGGLPASAIVDPQHVAAGVATDGLNAGNALITLLTAAGYTLVVASFRNGGVARTTAVATPVTTVLCNTQIDTQRKRLKQ